ncbi:hypothetical protein KAI87_05400, partial [Myxococcota bacterium]|nr:hypothetical protein [Myxococcota bacterium]
MLAVGQYLLSERSISTQDLDEAIKRQVIAGGSLGTALLETNAVDEKTLIRALSAVYRLPAVDKLDIDQVPEKISEVFPLIFAESYRIVPYRLVGKNLGALIGGQPDYDLLDSVANRVQIHVQPAIATEVRLHYAMHRVYGIKLLPRMEALLTKLDGIPPQSKIVPPGDQGDRVLSWGVHGDRIAPLRTRGGVRKREIDVPALIARLEASTNRDAITELTLQAALTIFEYAGLYIVHGDDIRGWRSIDPQNTQRTAAFSTHISKPSIFQTVFATGSHYLGAIPDMSENRAFLQTIDRQSPRTAFLSPLHMGDKMGAILYADNGSRGIPSKHIASLLVIISRAGHAFENLIRESRSSIPKASTVEARVPLSHLPDSQTGAQPELLPQDAFHLVGREEEKATTQAVLPPIAKLPTGAFQLKEDAQKPDTAAATPPPIAQAPAAATPPPITQAPAAAAPPPIAQAPAAATPPPIAQAP